MDEGRKRVIGIMAAILAARKLAQYDGGNVWSASRSSQLWTRLQNLRKSGTCEAG